MSAFRSLWPWRGEIVPQPVTMRDIGEAVAARHGLTLERLKGPEQARHIAWPRQVAFAEIYATGRYSLPRIGRFFNRDHTTVRHGVQKVRALAQQEVA